MCLCTGVLIFRFQKDCHTEKYPGGEYNNQTETWAERQEIDEVCTDTEWTGAILAGVALFMISLLCFVFIGLPVLGCILSCCGCKEMPCLSRHTRACNHLLQRLNPSFKRL